MRAAPAADLALIELDPNNRLQYGVLSVWILAAPALLLAPL